MSLIFNRIITKFCSRSGIHPSEPKSASRLGSALKFHTYTVLQRKPEFLKAILPGMITGTEHCIEDAMGLPCGIHDDRLYHDLDPANPLAHDLRWIRSS